MNPDRPEPAPPTTPESAAEARISEQAASDAKATGLLIRIGIATCVALVVWIAIVLVAMVA